MRKKSGYILVLTILVIGMLFFFALCYLNLLTAEKTITRRVQDDLVAHAAAEAGMDAAIYHLEGDPAWTGTWDRIVLPHSGASYTVRFEPRGQVFSTSNMTGSDPVRGYGGRVVPSGAIHLVCVGEYGGAQRIEQCMITAGSLLFRNAAYVRRTISLVGSANTDSYDSSAGSYEQTHVNQYGDIGTNQGSAGTVSMTGNSAVNGTVTVGPGGSSGSVNGVVGQSYQGLTVLTEPIPLNDVSVPVGATPADVTVNRRVPPTVLPPGSYRNLTVGANGVVELSEGTYVLSGNLDMSAGGQLKLPPGGGRVQIYVLGSTVSLSGNSIDNQTSIASNLVIYGGPNTRQVTITGNGQACFALYAPEADIRITGNGQIFGSLVGNSLTMTGNGALHFDRALRRLVNPSAGGISVTSRW